MHWRFSITLGIFISIFFLLSIVLIQNPTTHAESREKGDREDIIGSFETEIQEQEDQLFGIALYFEGILILWSHDKNIIEMNRKAYENIMKRGNAFIKEAKQLLYEAQKDPGKVELIRQFQFPPIYGHPMVDEMTKRAKILVETYNELFPGRPRANPLTQAELMLLMEAAANKL